MGLIEDLAVEGADQAKYSVVSQLSFYWPGMFGAEKLVRLASCVLVSVWFFPTALNGLERE
jgi:hypothetical protein